MRSRVLSPLLLLLPLAAFAQDSSDSTITGSTSAITGSNTAVGDVAQTTNLTYISYSSTITLSGASSSATANATNETSTSTSNSVTRLVGGTATGNSTASSTSTRAQPTNTQKCNGYVEFCDRSYSNISMVAAHNFPFTKKNNAARNQNLEITTQLNDGIRMRKQLGISIDIISANTINSPSSGSF